MSERRKGTAGVRVLGIGAALALIGATVAAAQTRGLIPGGSQANYETLALSGEIPARAQRLRMLSGGDLDARSMGLGSSCVGFVTARPDVIFTYADPAEHLHLFIRSNGGDTTLIVHTPDGRWLCDDDGGGSLNPSIELPAPPAGQYDVWVGSYDPAGFHRVHLHVRAGPAAAADGAEATRPAP